MQHTAEQTEQMKTNPQSTWISMKFLKKVCTGHHEEVQMMQLRSKEGKNTTTDSERVEEVGQYFREVINIDLVED